MKNFLKAVNLCLIFLLAQHVFAQQAPFYDEIQNFKKEDSAKFPPANAILFVGSSSFRKWTDVQSYFPDKTIINRGFGGSQTLDVVHYANDIIAPYHPKEVVIYVGDNDFAASDTVTAKLVFQRFIVLYSTIRKALPKATIAYVSIKPSPSRKNLMTKMEDANKMISNFLFSQKNSFFIDVYHKMLTDKGEPMPDIFEDDKLHMNAKGYHIWQKAIEPYLK